MALLQMVRGLDCPATVHGFRSSFRDWVAEETEVPREIAEAALAHTLENKVEAAYRRTDFLAKRRTLMTSWADYCLPPKPGARQQVLRRRSARGRAFSQVTRMNDGLAHGRLPFRAVPPSVSRLMRTICCLLRGNP
jgi:hypothetical protein